MRTWLCITKKVWRQRVRTSACSVVAAPRGTAVLFSGRSSHCHVVCVCLLPLLELSSCQFNKVHWYRCARCYSISVCRRLRDVAISDDMSQMFWIFRLSEAASNCFTQKHLHISTYIQNVTVLYSSRARYLQNNIWVLYSLGIEQRTGNRKTDKKKWQMTV